MAFWSRIVNVFRGDRLNREIDEEIQAHIEEAIDQGRDPAEARKAFGSALRQREASRDVRLVVWLDSLRADAIFGWRQLMKRKITSSAAILSLGLAIGACTAAFRIIDALFLRPLPVAHPEQLYALAYQGIDFDGKPRTGDSCEYPMFRQMRAAVAGQAELLAISYAQRSDLTYSSDQEMEKAYVQYVSGWTFGALGARPAAGRLFTESDDLKPGAHPVAILSYDYWSRRFGRDPKIIGLEFRFGNNLYTIVGAAGKGFTGIEPGTMTDIFVPTMMHPSVESPDSVWFRTLAILKPGVAIEPVREKLHAVLRRFRQEQVKGFGGLLSQQAIENYISERVMLASAATGVSEIQRQYSRPLAILGLLVALVLLIACANIANLMTAQGASRARELALRVSIGAGRFRLVQLVLVESAWLGFFATVAGVLFAWWAAPFVVGRINPPDRPARLPLSADWRVLGFISALTLSVTVLFALIPALRASAVKPASALKGGEQPLSRSKTMQSLIAVQSAFCFSVLFIASMFVVTAERLSNQPTGFAARRILNLDTVAQQPQPPAFWDQVVQYLRVVPGVETAALARWPLMSGSGSLNYISISGGAPSPDPVLSLDISPGWLDAMSISLLSGRDFRANDVYPKVAIVNQAFAKRYFPGQSPLGKSFANGDGNARLEIIGVAADARYSDMRGPIAPTAYVPFRYLDAQGGIRPRPVATLIVRTTSPNPLALASILRREVPRARSEFRVSNIRTQEELNQSQTVRERLLALLALFFAAVALLLAAIGLYGVLEYSVHTRRREIAIRVAIGAPSADIARRVTVAVFSMVLLGAVAGLALGLGSARYVAALLYQVKVTDPAMFAAPSLAIFISALAAALPAVTRAIRIDPADVLRSE